jgi:hypothetical protein
MTEGNVVGFVPTTNAFTFTNSFPSEPTIHINLGPAGTVGLGNASQGVCGGMAFAVRDYFEAKRPIPTDTEPPGSNTPLFHYIVRRLIDSFDLPLGAARYANWMVMPSADLHLIIGHRAGTFSRTVNTSWPKARADIDAGHPSPLGLVTVHTADLTNIGRCHQVLAYGYVLDDSGIVTLKVYDPNTRHDQADQVWISFDTSEPHTVSPIAHNINIAEPTLHGFFRSDYEAKIPLA